MTDDLLTDLLTESSTYFVTPGHTPTPTHVCLHLRTETPVGRTGDFRHT